MALIEDAKTLLGRQVRVKLDEGIIQEGLFLAFGDYGDLVIEDEMGERHYCWPMLDIEAIEPDNEPTYSEPDDELRDYKAALEAICYHRRSLLEIVTLANSVLKKWENK